MRHRRVPALLLALALSVGLLTCAAAAAETDAQSQATQKSAREYEPQEKSGTQDGSTQEEKTGRRKKQEAAEPENAIGKEAAVEKALADAGLSADAAGKVRTRVRESDGTVCYKVRFTCDGQRYSYKIDAVSGQILDKTVEEAAGETRRTRQKHDKTQEAQDTTESA